MDEKTPTPADKMREWPCEAMSPDGSVRCALGRVGHPPYSDAVGVVYRHAAPSLGVLWAEITPEEPATPEPDDATALLAVVADELKRLGHPRVRVGTRPDLPVRLRFVDLPHRNVPREVCGVMAHTIEPGGFALVVDRFRHLAHLDAEHGMWTAFGETLGAATVLCYPGELDIVGWLADCS